MLLEDPVPEVGNAQPLRGDNARWAGIDGVTMVVYSLATSEAGGPELQIYQRVLTDKGMTITFKRL